MDQAEKTFNLLVPLSCSFWNRMPVIFVFLRLCLTALATLTHSLMSIFQILPRLYPKFLEDDNKAVTENKIDIRRK